MKRKTEMRATVVECVEAVPISDDEQWAGPAANDGHTFGRELLQIPGVDPIVSRAIGSLLITGLAHRAWVHQRVRLDCVRQSSPVATLGAA